MAVETDHLQNELRSNPMPFASDMSGSARPCRLRKMIALNMDHYGIL